MSVTTRYMVVEVHGIHLWNSRPLQNGSAAINELEFWNGGTKLTYTTTSDGAYDEIANDLPVWWNGGFYNRQNLNDGVQPPVGAIDSNAITTFLWESSPTATERDKRARFMVDFGSTVTV